MSSAKSFDRHSAEFFQALKEVEAVVATVQQSLDAASKEAANRRTTADVLDEPGAMSPDAALYKLMSGHRRFLLGESAHPHMSEKRLQLLSATQRPYAAVLGCSDSRVPVELLFDVGFGDVFVCRVAGNIATNEEIGSLEYGVLELKTSLIVIVGHAKCGACKAALSGNTFPGYLNTLVDSLGVPVERAYSSAGLMTPRATAKDAKTRVPRPELLDNVIKENVKYQVERLMKSNVLREAVNAGKLKVIGTYYNLDTGHVALLDEWM